MMIRKTDWHIDSDYGGFLFDDLRKIAQREKFRLCLTIFPNDCNPSAWATINTDDGFRHHVTLKDVLLKQRLVVENALVAQRFEINGAVFAKANEFREGIAGGGALLNAVARKAIAEIEIAD